MRKPLYATALALALHATAALGFVQPPILFERWEQPPVGPLGQSASGVEFGLTQGQIYQQYAAQLLIGLPVQGTPHEQKDMRLIDIEIRSDGSGLANYLYDIVWVRNEGTFQLDSWFVTGLTADEVKLFELFDDVIITDIERYPKGLEWRFAIILQRNSGKFHWEVLLDVTTEQAAQAAAGTDRRIVDVDTFLECGRGRSRGSACPVGLDVVWVSNTSTNAVGHVDLLFGPPPSPAGHQPVDIEINAFAAGLSNWVTPANPYIIYGNQTENEVIFNHNHHGRVVDLEPFEKATGRGPGTTIAYWTVNLTNQ